MKYHTEEDNGYLCLRTNKMVSSVFWNGLSPCPEGEDKCARCSSWTIGSRLAELSERRRVEAEF